MIYAFLMIILSVLVLKLGGRFLVQIEMLLLLLFIVPLIQILEFLMKSLTLC